MLSLEEIGQSVRNNLQLIIDSQGLRLAIGPISDQDYRILCGGFGELEWDIGLGLFGNEPDRFEFCVKLVKDVTEAIPSGIALCVYSIRDKIFKIHMIESFIRHDDEHPLKGRMVMLTLMATYLFGMAVEASEVQIIEPALDLIEYYSSFGFEYRDSIDLMVSSVQGLESAFKAFAES